MTQCNNLMSQQVQVLSLRNSGSFRTPAKGLSAHPFWSGGVLCELRQLITRYLESLTFCLFCKTGREEAYGALQNEGWVCCTLSCNSWLSLHSLLTKPSRAQIWATWTSTQKFRKGHCHIIYHIAEMWDILARVSVWYRRSYALNTGITHWKLFVWAWNQ
jgi:hypothetical protein